MTACKKKRSNYSVKQGNGSGNGLINLTLPCTNTKTGNKLVLEKISWSILFSKRRKLGAMLIFFVGIEFSYRAK